MPLPDRPGAIGRVLTPDDAAQAALGYIREMQPHGWEPVVVRIEDVRDAWRVFYNSRAYAETGETRHRLAGNWPLLVPKDGGEIQPDEQYRREALNLDAK